ncbi:hypothetical protein C4D60_Mb06t01080 [Musa balbisiana]|uniref:ALOG domain-containing protein n=1 Tax=Musa balbisiana TaxID=52838 RepID=A0A4V4H3K8_MUSBA|nr:hypothetical protein C4D60_Mb06t01080 [Musa balbisiana]
MLLPLLTNEDLLLLHGRKLLKAQLDLGDPRPLYLFFLLRIMFGKTKVHLPGCAFYGHPSPPAPCTCPLRQAWGSLDALIGRLRAAYEESGGSPETNPFAARAVRIFLRDVRDSQAKARGIPYEKKKRRRAPTASDQVHGGGESSSSAALSGDSSGSGAGEGSAIPLWGSSIS